jgi:hypothetical protein
MLHGFYIKSDPKQEIINRTVNSSRLEAAKYFSQKKQLDLKSFLKIYSVKRLWI